MFNFSANNLVWLQTQWGDKFFVHQLVDADTKRTYKLYDFKKEINFQPNLQYCVFGKVNSADKIYLVVEKVKVKQKKVE